jgi:dienelactone hydrolase
MQFIFILCLVFSLSACAGTITNRYAETTVLSSNPVAKDRMPAEDVEIPVEVYRTRKQSAPTVVFGHSCSGVHDSRATNMLWIQTINSWGYNVVVPDSFSPRGVNGVCADTKVVSAARRMPDIKATVQWVKTQAWHSGKVGFIGFSHGGTLGDFVAKGFITTGVDAVVSYYPYCNTQIPRIKERANVVPQMIHIGTKDEWTPPKMCEPWRDKPNYEIHIYDGAYHSFDRQVPDRWVNSNTGRHFLQYNHAATTQAEARTKEFFERNLR